MRITIATIYNELNYGAYLQAYALANKLEQMGHEVKFVNIQRHTCLDYFHMMKFREPKFILKRIHLLYNYSKCWKLLKKESVESNNRDVLIIGSDELWNVKNSNFIHSPVYIGKSIQANRIITYAVSCNGCSAEDFMSIYGDNAFDTINYIGVRDLATKELVNKISSKVPIITPDPTFLIDWEHHKDSDTNDEKYLLIYGFWFSENEKELICRLAKKNRWRVYSVGFQHDWVDKNIVGGPLDFPQYIEQAQFVVSATFHGTVFSIIKNKQFAVFTHGSDKIQNVIKEFGLNAIMDKNNLDDIVSYDINYGEINKRITSLREVADSYFELAGIKNEI